MFSKSGVNNKNREENISQVKTLEKTNFFNIID